MIFHLSIFDAGDGELFEGFGFEFVGGACWYLVFDLGVFVEFELILDQKISP